jgi:hypothetical protein
VPLLTILAAAAEHAAEDGASKTPFYVIGGLFALFAVIVGILGITRPGQGGVLTRATMVIGGVLAVATAAAMVAVS